MKLPSVLKQEAKVVSSVKYNQSTFLFFQEFCNDVVFESGNGSTISKTIINVNLPLYAGQKVKLIWTDDILIAYEDNESEDVYYFTENPAQEFNQPGITWTKVMAGSVILFILFNFFLKPAYSTYVPLVLLLPLGFRIFRMIQHYFINRKIDKLLTN
jgi:hypothetical protein